MVWRLRGSCASTRRTSGREAHVEHAVGLVEDEHLDAVEARRSGAEVVEQASGRGDDDVDAGAQCAQLRPGRDAAEHGRRARPGMTGERAQVLVTWAASSRVGVRTRARTPRPGRSARRCRIGSTNAAVLPLPVIAAASRSRPSSAGGRTARWTGVGSMKPRSAMPRWRAGLRRKSENDICTLFLTRRAPLAHRGRSGGIGGTGDCRWDCRPGPSARRGENPATGADHQETEVSRRQRDCLTFCSGWQVRRQPVVAGPRIPA